jgi:hypothetical protein
MFTFTTDPFSVFSKIGSDESSSPSMRDKNSLEKIHMKTLIVVPAVLQGQSTLAGKTMTLLRTPQSQRVRANYHWKNN